MGQRGLAAGCVLWAALGLAIALAGFVAVNDDARVLVLTATTLGVGAAASAARLILLDRYRWAGLCLVVSVVTPTWGAAAVNLVPLVAGLVLISGWVSPQNRRLTESDQ